MTEFVNRAKEYAETQTKQLDNFSKSHRSNGIRIIELEKEKAELVEDLTIAEERIEAKEKQLAHLWDTDENLKRNEYLNSVIVRLHDEKAELVGFVKSHFKGHYACEDCWYSCPKSEGCCRVSYDDVPIEERTCDCGYDKAKALLAKLEPKPEQEES